MPLRALSEIKIININLRTYLTFKLNKYFIPVPDYCRVLSH